tara:strand:+ start:1937 stop:2095 length:159 start_codon:yes stop_codon:yes gene_type:complete
MRIIENGYSLLSLQVNTSLASVNEPYEVAKVFNHFTSDEEQKILFQQLLSLS